jgi:hypothetical protein
MFQHLTEAQKLDQLDMWLLIETMLMDSKFDELETKIDKIIKAL